MAESIRVLLIDQPLLSRRCLGAYLQRQRGLRVLADTGSGKAGLALARTQRPDVVIVEPAVPEGGRDLIADLTQSNPGGAVVALTDGTGESGVISVAQALQAGARAYIEKACEPGDLARAIHRVAHGEVVVSVKAEAIATEVTAGGLASPPGPSLTSREREVVRLVAAGFTNAEIARTLCITEHTAKGYLAQMLRKLELGNRVQLATFALQQGLGPPAGLGAPAATPG
ncbi:MAG TPA: response regulator transcription factor [Chloroflexota bacterium]